ncbi:MAG: hypothetical protein ACXADH_09070 [Candidatus Kariarchaeaceae archaeon]|jgi:hypothetical protein
MGAGQWIKKGVVAFSLAAGKVEKDSLNQTSKELESNRNAQINPYYRNQLMADLKAGKLTEAVKEFRAKHYMILKEAEKYKAKWGKDGDFQLIKEDDLSAYKNAKGDPFDNYVVEVTVDNKAISGGLLTEETTRPIKVQRGVFPRHKIEEHADTVLIRNIDGKNKLIEFYIPNNQYQDRYVLREVQYLQKNPQVSDFVNITNLSFTTPGGDMLQFEYKMLAFDKVVEHNGNYIVKMFAECIVDGRWAGEKYMLD